MNATAALDVLALVILGYFMVRLMFGMVTVFVPGATFGIGPAIIERFVSSLSLTNSQSSFLDLPRDFLYAALRLKFRGSLVISAGTTNGTVNDDNPMTYMRRLIVEGTGGGQSLQLKNVRGIHGYRIEHLLTGVEPNAAPVVSGAVGTTVINAVVTLWFALPHTFAQPEISLRSVLNPREFSRLSLEIQAGDATDFVNGGDRTVVVTAPIVDVYALQVVNLNLVQSPLRYVEQLLLRDSTSAVATERRLTNPLPVGRPYRYLYARTTNEAANVRQPVDDALAAVKLFISQTLILRYVNFQEYAENNRREHMVIQATNPAGLNPLSSRDNPVIGSYMFDFLKNARLEGVLDATRFPARGIPLDFLHDIATASARQIDIVAGFLVPSPFAATQAPNPSPQRNVV